MARVTRGIVIYDVWVGAGDPVPNPTYNITVEDWGGRIVAVMTITEDDFYLTEVWDNGYKQSVDMRSYPRNAGGSGGTINLLDDGWYNSFVSAGYNFEGCRVARTWNGDFISQHYVDKVSQNKGLVTLPLITLDDKMNATIGNGSNPLTVGNWNNVKVERTGEGEQALFDGQTFRWADVDPANRAILDDYGAIIGYTTFDFIPTDPNYSSGLLAFPSNTYIRVNNGIGEGYVLNVNEGFAPVFIDPISGKKYFSTGDVDLSLGLELTDDFEYGLAYRIADTLAISELSVFDFATIVPEYNYDSSATVEKVFINGKEITDYTAEDGKIKLKTQFNSSAIFNPTFVNATEDLTQYMDDPSGTTRVGGNVYHSTGRTETYNNTASVSDRRRDTNQFARCAKEVGIGYETTEDVPDAIGVCVDVELENCQSAFVTVIAYWKNDTDWLSEEAQETVYRSEFANPLGTLIGVDYDLKNFGANYFEDSLDVYPQEPFDERKPDLSASKTGYRGRVEFELTSPDTIKTSPDKIVVFINALSTFSGIIFDEATITVNEIAFFGEKQDLVAPDELSVNISGRNWSNMKEAIEQVAVLQNWDSLPNVDIDVPQLSQKVRNYTTKESDLKTSRQLENLLREAWCIGRVNRTGTYDVTLLENKIGFDHVVDDSHNFVFPNGYRLVSNVLAYESDTVPTGGTIQYGLQSDGSYANSITVSNADADTYDASYVSGVSDPVVAEDLWNRCHGIYLKTGVLNDVRNDLSKLNWLYQEGDVIRYFVNILEWNGGSDFTKDVRIIEIEAVSIDNLGATDDYVLWNRGEECRITIPNVLVGEYTGIITGVEYNPDDYSANLTIRVGELNQRPARIIEGDNTTVDKIIELDTNTDRIVEVGI